MIQRIIVEEVFEKIQAFIVEGEIGNCSGAAVKGDRDNLKRREIV